MKTFVIVIKLEFQTGRIIYIIILLIKDDKIV